VTQAQTLTVDLRLEAVQPLERTNSHLLKQKSCFELLTQLCLDLQTLPPWTLFWEKKEDGYVPHHL
jgi:hypothetical protein